MDWLTFQMEFVVTAHTAFNFCLESFVIQMICISENLRSRIQDGCKNLNTPAPTEIQRFNAWLITSLFFETYWVGRWNSMHCNQSYFWLRGAPNKITAGASARGTSRAIYGRTSALSFFWPERTYFLRLFRPYSEASDTFVITHQNQEVFIGVLKE